MSRTAEVPPCAPAASSTGASRRAQFTDERDSVVVGRVKIYGTRETRRAGLIGAAVAAAALGLDLFVGGAGRIHPVIVIVSPMYLFACLWLVAVAAPAGSVRFDERLQRFERGEPSWWWNGLITSVFVGAVVGIVASLYLRGFAAHLP